MNLSHIRMESPSTPKNLRRNQGDSLSPFLVPHTPAMTKIGYGTGVSVYHIDRSPRFGQERSPWVVKKRNDKVLRGDISGRLQREAEILRSLNHPNIIGFRGFTKSRSGSEALIMEECSQSLGDFIEEYRKISNCFPRNTILHVVLSVANALHYLHVEKSMIHGDIKSFNILIKGAFESIKLCDFGVSLSLREDGTSQDEYVGSLPWIPPEALVDGPITPAADIFALGLTIYEMLALQPPHMSDFNDDSFIDKTMDSDMMEASLVEPPYGTRPELPSLSPVYSDVIALYVAFTEEDYKLRPTASIIISTISAFPHS